MAEKKPTGGKKKPNRGSKYLIRVSKEDHEMLAGIAKEEDRSIRAEAHQAFLDFFRKKGKLPPATST